MRSYFSPGKIMLCGEYAVTIGVEALAVPTDVGQWMHVWEFDSPTGGDRLIWEAKEKDGSTWLNDSFALPLVMDQDQSEVREERKLLLGLLSMADASIWRPGKSYRIETQLEFERSSGLGSSSTLIANFSRFAGLDPQKVQQAIFGGSGYDVAVAELGKGLVFWKSQDMAHWGPWELSSTLTQNWKVVFLGEKQNSRDALNNVKLRLQEVQQDDFLFHQLQQVCAAVKMANQVPMLEAGLEMWQAILSMSLGLQTPYQHFGFQPVKGGLCKWLGAWGGDMLLVNGVFEEAHRPALEKYKLVAWNQIVATSKGKNGSY
jgi:mevalonate kinase